MWNEIFITTKMQLENQFFSLLDVEQWHAASSEGDVCGRLNMPGSAQFTSFDAQLDYLLDDKEMCQVVSKGSTWAVAYLLDDKEICQVVPKGSTWARNPIPRIHDDNIGMAFVGRCKGPQQAGGFLN